MAVESAQTKLSTTQPGWRRISWTTWGVVALQSLIYTKLEKGMDWGLIGPFIDDFSFHWTVFQADPFSQIGQLLSYTLLHGSRAHLISNLLFLAIFGPTVERAVGHLYFLAGYILWGIVAALTHGFFSPFGGGLIGSSGAISGAAGAFFVLFPLRLPPAVLGRWFGRVFVNLPAFFLIGLWFLWQLRQGFFSLLAPEIASRVTIVAYWAHIGGFSAGALFVAPWALGKSRGKY